jgi:hypothetical protein
VLRARRAVSAAQSQLISSSSAEVGFSVSQVFRENCQSEKEGSHAQSSTVFPKAEKGKQRGFTRVPLLSAI